MQSLYTHYASTLRKRTAITTPCMGWYCQSRICLSVWCDHCDHRRWGT